MRSLNRGLEKIKHIIDNSKIFCNKNIEPFNSAIEYDCRICHSKKHREFTNVRGYRYALCEDCGSIILLNIPNIKKLYDSDDTKASDIYLDDEAFLKRVEAIATPKMNFVSEFIAGKTNKNSIWCDVGCGVGELLMALKRNTQTNMTFEGIGIEIDPREIQFGIKKGLKIVEGFIDPDKPVDELIQIISQAEIVSMFNVLEHIEHPDKIINFYKKYMKTGAYLVIEVPHHPSLASFVNLVSPDLTYRHITPPLHLQVFSEQSIEKLMGNAFCLLATWGFGQGYTDILTSTMILGNVKEMSLYQQLMDISNDVQKVIDKNGYADQMIYILKKQ